nr:reverse transcriptase domain-containing protein [Tanacetum cinerariifolium]
MNFEPLSLADFPTALFNRLLGEIRVFYQHENKSLTDAWLRIKEMLRNCHGHNLSKGSIIKIFYHGLNEITQEVLNAAAGDTFMDLKNKLETTTKNHQASIQILEAKFDRFADKQSARPSGFSLVTLNLTRKSDKSYDPPDNNDQQNNSETPINFDSDDEDDEPTPQPKPKNPKPLKETPKPKPYKTKIPYPQRLRKEIMEAQYRKFLDMIRAVRINKWKKTVQFPLSWEALSSLPMLIRVKQKQLNLGVGTEQMIFYIDSAMKHSYSNDDTCFSIDVTDEILEEDFDALLDESSKILHSIEGTILEEKLFAEFDEFMAMTANENSESESNIEEPSLKKITFNTDYKIKTSLEELPTDLELKPLPDNLEYVFLEEPSFLPVIISSQLSEEDKNKLEKCHFMVKEGIMLGQKASEAGLEVDKVKIEVISKLSPPTNIKAQALPTNDARVVITFLKKLFCSFEMPKALISDRGTHFYNKIMEKTMKRYGVNHQFSTSYHPQTSGQVENINIALKRTLEKTIKDNPAIWSRKLDDALWAFRSCLQNTNRYNTIKTHIWKELSPAI